MLKLKILPQVLEQANTGGVRGSLLVNSEGSLLASAGDSAAQKKAVAAIASNIWNSYQSQQPENNDLNYLAIECEQGSFVATSCGGFLLVVFGNKEACLGMLKAKASTLRGHLEGPLSSVTSA